MATNTFSEKTPPNFDREKDNYSKWKKKFSLWETITDVDRSKRGSLIVLRLDDETQDSVMDSVSEDDLKSNAGAEKVIAHLDKLFLKDSNFTEFQLYEEFENFRREGLSVDKYIEEFEKKWVKTKNKGTVLSENVLAYRLLKSADLSRSEQQLLIATVADNTYNSMKEQLRKVFVGKFEKSTFKVKSEPEEEIHFNMKQKSRYPPRDNNFQRNWSNNKFERSPQRNYNNKFERSPPRNYNSNYNKSGRQYERESPKTNRKEWSQNKKSDYSTNRNNQSIKKKSRNPPDQYGNITRCFICDSVNHYARFCPDRETQAFIEETCNKENSSEETFHAVTLQQEDSQNHERRNGLVRESLGSMVLDCGASRNVCGQLWYSCYIESLPAEERMQVKEYKSNQLFKFGDGVSVGSIKTVEFPALIGKVSVVIVSDVVDCNIPFLLSMNSMREAGMDLKLYNDTVVVFGQTIKLIISTTGHYILPLGVKSKPVVRSKNSSGSEILNVRNESVDAVALKLHRQFSHPSADRLIKLVKDQGKECEDLINAVKKVSQECKICQEYRKPPARPVVGFPLANRFNQCIAMDLKQFKNVHLLHIVDHATRLSAGAIIRSKKPSVIIQEVFRNWIAIYGSPEKILSDNGGEFNNPEMRELGEKLNVTIKTTAAESPWSNGLVERHNSIIGAMIDKTVRDIGCSLELAMSWSIAAHNSLMNVHGFSPFQLVFSRNPTIPCLQNANLPALNNETTSDIIRKNLEALHAARQAFIASESSEKIRRALQHNVRTSTEQKYVTNDKVYYKRLDSKVWKGPATVLGQDGQQVLVKHGGVYVRVHPCRLSLVKETVIGEGSNANLEDVESQNHVDRQHRFVDEVQENVSRLEEREQNENVSLEPSRLDESSVVERGESSTPLNNEREVRTQVEQAEPLSIDDPTTIQDEVNRDENVEEGTDSESTSSNFLDNESGNNFESNQQVTIAGKQITPIKTVKLKEGMRVKYKDASTRRNVIVDIGKRAGKASGKYKGEWNVRNQQGIRSVVNFEKDALNLEVLEKDSGNVSSVNVIEELNLSEIFISQNKEEVTSAKIKELESWKKNNVYEEVPFEDQKCISSKWVIKPKIVDNKFITKARLVLKGYEEEECVRTDAPCCMRESVRLLLTITAMMKWDLNSVDFKTAFLQGDFIQREVYMVPPKEAETNMLWKIKKAVYGLNDGPRQWYIRLRDTITSTGCVIHSLDPGLFYLHVNSNLCGLLISYVDDILWSGNSHFREMVIKRLVKLLEISVENSEAFDYVGIQLKQEEDKSIILSQHAYINSIEEIEVKDSDKHRLLCKEEIKKLRRAAGQLNWATNISRPDMGFGACEVATSVPKATVSSILNANKWIRHIKNNQSHIKFPILQNPENLKVIVYTDASYANLPGGFSQGGQLVFLSDGKNSAPILWHSRKIKRVVKNTIGAETLALAEGAESGFLIAKIANEVIFGNKDSQLPVTCITDNLSLYQAAHTTGKLVDSRLIIDMAIIREMISKDEINLEWVPGSEQISDVLTKKGASRIKLAQVVEQGYL